MSLLDKKQFITANLSTGEAESKSTACYYNTDKNVIHFYLKFKIENEDEGTIILSRDSIKDFNVKLFIIRPDATNDTLIGKLNSDEDKNSFVFNLTDDFVNKIGKYQCKLIVSHNDDVSTFTYFSYEIKGAIESELSGIEDDERYPVLVKLINDVKELQQNILIEDNLTSDSTTSALSAKQGKILNDKINELKNRLNS